MGRKILKSRNRKHNMAECAELLERNSLGSSDRIAFFSTKDAMIGRPTADLTDCKIENFLYRDEAWNSLPTYHAIIELPHPMRSKPNKIVLLRADNWKEVMHSLAKAGHTGASVPCLTLKKHMTVIDHMDIA